MARRRGLHRAPAGRVVRGLRHEARAALEAVLLASTLLLFGAGRADPEQAAGADARRARDERPRVVSRRRLHRLLPARARAVSRVRRAPARDLSAPGLALRGVRLAHGM